MKILLLITLLALLTQEFINVRKIQSTQKGEIKALEERVGSLENEPEALGGQEIPQFYDSDYWEHKKPRL